jgi:cobalt-zinc-cadmium efflux system outer membrane protein
VGLSVPLPLFDNGRYAVMAAKKALHQAENERRAVEFKLLDQLQSAWNDLRNAHMALGTLRSETLPDANRAYQMAEEGYRIGRYDYLYLLDAQRTLFDVKEQALDSMARYHLAVADLEGLIGEALFTQEEVAEGHLE